MAVSTKIKGFMEKSSWIRKMFEEGAKLKAEHGADKVFDFSLGNPIMSPPGSFKANLLQAVESTEPGNHAYMPNSGYPHVRKSVAQYVSKEQGKQVDEDHVIMTCGAAGAINIILKAILDPGDEVITPTPFFVEYSFYADNHAGILKTVKSNPDFTLDLGVIEEAINEKTKAVIINSPNNPTGQIYSKESLDGLGAILREKSKQHGHTIYLISDEPYRKLIFDGLSVPSIFTAYDESIVAASYSKDISIPGERIGFLALSPDASNKEELMAGMTLANRILGFVNAPALMQRVVGCMQGDCVDVSVYERNRDLFFDGLVDAGYDVVKPKGAFYLFPKSPVEDEVGFVSLLQEELILAVPGRGFGGPGHFRLAFCVDDKTIINSMPGFKRALEKARG